MLFGNNYSDEKDPIKLIEIINELVYEQEKTNWIVSNVPGLLFLTDLNGNILGFYGNEKEIFNQQSNIIGKSVSEILPDSVVSIILNNIRQTDKNNESSCEYNLFEDEKVNWYFLRSKKVHSKSGRVLFTHNVTNISEYKRMQKSLIEKEEIYRTLFDKSLNGEAIAERDTGILIDCNLALADMIKRNKKEIIGKHQSFLHNCEEDNPFKRHVSIPGETIQGRLLAKDGEILDVEIKANLLLIDNKEYLHAEFHNISKERKAKIELERSQRKFQTVFDYSRDALMTLVAPKWNFDSCNPATLKMFGVEKEDEFVKFPPWHFSPEFQSDKRSSSEKAQEMIDLAVKNGSHFFEWTHMRSNGEEFPATVLLTSMSFEGKLFVQATVRDVTEIIKTQKALIEAERLSAIGEMATGVAHDFNNALQVIFGNIDMALHEPSVPESVKVYLTNVYLSASDVAKRITQLQRFCGQLSTKGEFVTVDIKTLVGDVVVQSKPLWKDKAESKGIAFDIESNIEKGLFVLGSEGELRTALLNLLKNSLEAMPEGGKILFEGQKNNEMVEIIISDTGIGMNEKVRKNCFLPFFSTKGLEPGRGLGLSGVQGIIKEHKGKIKILKSSNLGFGTSIQILLPYKFSEVVESKIAKEKDRFVAGNFLWAEDEEMLRDIYKQQLEKIGHKATFVSSAEEALKQLSDKKNVFDLVITDVGMPGMNGWQLAEKIYELHPGTKVAIVSGWGNTISKDDMNEYGVEYLLSKPVKFAEIKKLTREVLSK